MSRVAVVTGAGRGIGAAAVAGLAAAGWRLVAVDRCEQDPRLPYPLATEAELDGVARAVNEASGEERVRVAVADAADEAAMAAVIESAEAWGEVEGIVANAGVIGGGLPAWETPPERDRAVIEGNLATVISTARVGIPALLRRPSPRAGRFVATASAAATRGLLGLAAYCAAKSAVSGYVRALAMDLRATGVTANAIAPGSTRTAMLDESARLYGLGSAEDFAIQQPLERLLEPAEVAAMIVWLLSAEAAAVTGATLPVDGGLAV